jgi:hypothetical protein
MATIKEAVHNAGIFASETLGPERTRSIQLEEVESARVGGEDVWLITLSMIAPPQTVTAAFNAALTEPRREYKVSKVKKNSGEVVSMRIRELAAT